MECNHKMKMRDDLQKFWIRPGLCNVFLRTNGLNFKICIEGACHSNVIVGDDKLSFSSTTVSSGSHCHQSEDKRENGIQAWLPKGYNTRPLQYSGLCFARLIKIKNNVELLVISNRRFGHKHNFNEFLSNPWVLG